jgi:hypothetical protein
MTQTESKLTPGQHKYWGAINNKLNTLKDRVRSIYYSAKSCKWDSKQIQSRLNNEVRNTVLYGRLPQAQQARVEGYMDAMYNIVWDHWTESTWKIGSIIVNEHERNDLMKRDPALTWAHVTYYARVWAGTKQIYFIDSDTAETQQTSDDLTNPAE